MKKSIILLFALTLTPFANLANADTLFEATIDGSQANSGNGTGSEATGFATLVLNDDMTELAMEITFEGITTAAMTAFHIHNGDAGVNGPVVFGLKGPNHDLDGDFMDLGNGFISAWDGNEGNATTLAIQLTDLFNAGLYFNAHTPAFPGGEIRGQIVAKASVLVGDINLDGSVNLSDVAPFVSLLSSGQFQAEADINGDGVVNLSDVAPFVELLSGG